MVDKSEQKIEQESRETGIPRTILRSDKHAQEIWKATHDSAVETYGEGEQAHRVAYAALKHEYEKQEDHWTKKEHSGPSDPQAARGPTTPHKSTEEPAAPTAGGKVAHSEAEARVKAKETRQEYAHDRREKAKTQKAKSEK